jgi:hypothetical protein
MFRNFTRGAAAQHKGRLCASSNLARPTT